MTEDQRADLLLYFSDMCVRLGAPGWELKVEMQPAGGEAGCFLADEQDTAKLYVAVDFFTRKPEEQRQLIIHEALHVALNRAHEGLIDVIDALTPRAFDRALVKVPEQIHERAIENLARAIAHLLPLPRWSHEQP